MWKKYIQAFNGIHHDLSEGPTKRVSENKKQRQGSRARYDYGAIRETFPTILIVQDRPLSHPRQAHT